MAAASQATHDQRAQSLEDRRFYSVAGAQWDGKYGDQFENRPRLEINKVNLAVYRILNEWRNNRITVNFVPKDGSEADDLAETCNGLYRADEEDSVAEEAHDVSFEEGCAGGFGAWRMCAEYEEEDDEENDAQRIRFEPLPDADTTVYFDPNARLYDKSDAKFCFVLTPYTLDAFTEEFEGETPSEWARPDVENVFSWMPQPDLIYVAEYYVREEQTYVLERWVGLGGDERKIAADKLDAETRAELKATGWTRADSRKIKRKRVHKYILSGSGVLEDCGLIAGEHLPIIPFYGKRNFIDGAEQWAGAVRYSKDPQRLYNMQLSSLAEVAARGGSEVPIFTPEQIAGHENNWANSAVDTPAYLLLNPVIDASGNEIPSGPIGYTKAPEVPTPTAALLQITNQDLADVLGNQQAGEEVDTQLSGKAMELVQTRLDQQSVIYMSNFAKSLKRCGQVWLSMARDLYTEPGRKMKTVGEQGQVEQVKINDETTFRDGRVEKAIDIGRASFDVTTDIGPTSSSKKSATVRSLIAMLQMVQDPADAKILTAAALMNMEGEGLKAVRKHFRQQLVAAGVEKPTADEQAEMDAAQQGAQPSPEEQFMMANAAKEEALAGKAVADTDLSRAKTAETLAGIEIDQRKSATDAAQTLRPAGTMPPQNGMR